MSVCVCIQCVHTGLSTYTAVLYSFFYSIGYIAFTFCYIVSTPIHNSADAQYNHMTANIILLSYNSSINKCFLSNKLRRRDDTDKFSAPLVKKKELVLNWDQ